ncbi:DUF7693 family protein [Pseudomonas laurylsulfativorans]|uniref:DUF7693 family protein n=1 Tax=Pseudomonas laurylsulfativorans TaxID=1943631 RepID=UPI003B83688E
MTCDSLDFCEDYSSPKGRVGTLSIWQRYSVDPGVLLSGWEYERPKPRLVPRLQVW